MQVGVVAQTVDIEIAFLSEQIVLSAFQTSCQDGNFRQVVTTHDAYLHIAEQTRRGYRPREDRLLVDIALAVDKQIAFAFHAIEKQHDVVIAVAIHIGHVVAQVGYTDVAALVFKYALMEAAERHPVEDGNLVGHIHHDFLHTIARQVLNATEIEGAGKVFASDIRHIISIYSIHFARKLTVVEDRHSPLVLIALGIEQRPAVVAINDGIVLRRIAIDGHVHHALPHHGCHFSHLSFGRSIGEHTERLAPRCVDHVLVVGCIALGGHFSEMTNNVCSVDICIHKTLVRENPAVFCLRLVEHS